MGNNQNGGKGKLIALVIIVVIFVVGLVSCVSCLNSVGDGVEEATEELTAGMENAAGLEATDVQIIEEDYSKYITGNIVNTTDKELGSVDISINLYDEAGNQIGNTYDITSNLAAGGNWNFKAIVVEENFSTYEIVDITYY